MTNDVIVCFDDEIDIVVKKLTAIPNTHPLGHQFDVNFYFNKELTLLDKCEWLVYRLSFLQRHAGGRVINGQLKRQSVLNHTLRAYKLAEESMLTKDLIHESPMKGSNLFSDALFIQFMFHDAPEIILGDISRPLKGAVVSLNYLELEKCFISGLYDWLGINPLGFHNVLTKEDITEIHRLVTMYDKEEYNSFIRQENIPVDEKNAAQALEQCVLNF